jgi:prolyl-tRNA editing enzyme YbaK/EbsC (Cys-tRNA(Pro) deacylase)
MSESPDPDGFHPNVRAVIAGAAAAGITIEPRRFPEGTRTAEDAAAAIGVPVGAIVKSLVFLVDEAPVLVLVSGANRVDETALAAVAGGMASRRPFAAAVREFTGFPIGGVPPFGLATPMPVLVDEDLLPFETVWAAAGTPDAVFPIAPADLVRTTGGRVCGVADTG